MKPNRAAFTFLVAFTLLVAAAPVASADLPEGNGVVATSIKSLYDKILYVAIAIGVFVEVLILVIIFKFRNNRNVPIGEKERGHTKAEIVWTIVPTAILIYISVISINTLTTIETSPERAITVDVVGQQWQWTFTYPDGTVSCDVESEYEPVPVRTPDFPVEGLSDYALQCGTLRVRAGEYVKLDVRSKDVIHAIWIPELGIKIDAVPGRTNHVWFKADDPGEYILQCAEFCAGAHAYMRAKVIVFPETEPRLYGPPLPAGSETPPPPQG